MDEVKQYGSMYINALSNDNEYSPVLLYYWEASMSTRAEEKGRNFLVRCNLYLGVQRCVTYKHAGLTKRPCVSHMSSSQNTIPQKAVTQAYNIYRKWEKKHPSFTIYRWILLYKQDLSQTSMLDMSFFFHKYCQCVYRHRCGKNVRNLYQLTFPAVFRDIVVIVKMREHL